ncbi:hypothetical protein A8W25_31500 [Streptomyces sp. ERV7]|uniref:hypothetical protein n=1 Tax=Streptomyces sp. ERV7 TaxID=1322334 RepID=UPI0007F46622|nr:hypothetical protein [Streptomyces sp. ERV7]OAR26661.1 hypothetical protein A8W25_31500 [Streptomyces sp. ERV7]
MTLPAFASACLLVATLCYGVRCWLSPFGTCRHCDGLGFQLTHDRKGRPKRGKHCRRCKGHGIRIRIGRHLYNRAHRTYRAGTR